MKLIKIKVVLLIVLLGLFACSERENYTDGPSVLDIVESVTLNGKSAVIDHLSGEITVSLPGSTDLSAIRYESTAPDGVSINPSSGTTLDLTGPVFLKADNGFSERSYVITASLLPSKIAFLGDGASIDEIADDDVLAAAKWTEDNYGEDFVYISFESLSDESLNGVNVLFFHWDEVGFSRLPDALLGKLNVLSKFFVNGGKIVAGQHGASIVEELGRDDSGLKTIVGTGAGGDNPDTWGVGFSGTNAANALLEGVEQNPDGSVSMIDGGYKEDHNCMWDFASLDNPKYGSFANLQNAEVLATWDWNVSSQGTGGIILWNPSGRFKGSVITLGIGGMEWNMNDGRDNIYAENIRGVYKNAIDYLAAL